MQEMMEDDGIGVVEAVLCLRHDSFRLTTIASVQPARVPRLLHPSGLRLASKTSFRLARRLCSSGISRNWVSQPSLTFTAGRAATGGCHVRHRLCEILSIRVRR